MADTNGRITAAGMTSCLFPERDQASRPLNSTACSGRTRGYLRLDVASLRTKRTSASQRLSVTCCGGVLVEHRSLCDELAPRFGSDRAYALLSTEPNSQVTAR